MEASDKVSTRIGRLCGTGQAKVNDLLYGTSKRGEGSVPESLGCGSHWTRVNGL